MSAASEAAKIATPWLTKAFGQTFKLIRTAWMKPGPAKAAKAAQWQRLGENASGPILIGTGVTGIAAVGMVLNRWISGTEKTVSGALASVDEAFDKAGDNAQLYALVSLGAAVGLAALFIITRRK